MVGRKEKKSDPKGINPEKRQNIYKEKWTKSFGKKKYDFEEKKSKNAFIFT